MFNNLLSSKVYGFGHAYNPFTFFTIIQEPLLSDPIRMIILRSFNAVVALEIVERDTENF